MRFHAVLLVFASLVGCSATTVHVAPTEPPEDYESLPALWAHDLSVTKFNGYGRDEYCVESMIRDDTAVRYLVLIRVAAPGDWHVTTQTSPDGTEVETLKVRLSAGPSADELVAEFSHTLRTNGAQKLRFTGTTVLPRFGSGRFDSPSGAERRAG